MRYRRYRVFVAFAVIALVALFRFSSSSLSAPWRQASRESVGGWIRPQEPQEPQEHANPLPTWRSGPHIALQTKTPDLDVAAAKTTRPPQHPPAIVPVPTPVAEDDGTSRSSSEPIHWRRQSERFPVPSSKIVKLPSSKPKPIPKIQHVFKRESAAAKAERERKLDIIKGVFVRSWDGYREYAWLQDELSPVSGKFRNPFAGWGATLVDALDTLWIMGLKAEFDEAAKAVDKIDFTTTQREDIPLFETTIRYLGGLLAAYEISERAYPNLLSKAVELAEVLISAFDTPNRMPHTYYHWKPNFTSESDRASNRAIMSEIGSLSLEFTRLTQLTGEDKYYDAIARITDHLEEFQNKTRLPGMWPTYMDVSGCKVIEYTSQVEVPLQTPIIIPLDGVNPGETMVKKRQFDEERGSNGIEEPAPLSSPSRPACEDQGFVSATDGSEEYTLGGMSDSTYEYLPKEWLLLGGRVDKYRKMYEQSADVVKENLIFRPMLPKQNDILFSGKLYVPETKPETGNGELEAESAHLTCFAGGMFGMGARIFDRPEDLEIAKKLTEGCIWSYDMTPTGIMPEAYIAMPCESRKHCRWNETRYWEILDPNAEARLSTYKRQLESYKEQMVSASAWYQAELAAMTATPAKTSSQLSEAVATSTSGLSHKDSQAESNLKKRQQGGEAQAKLDPKTVPPWKPPVRNLGRKGGIVVDSVPPTPVEAESNVELDPEMPVFPAIYSPVPPATHREYVKARIRDERLPPGVTSIVARNYILRPEAIESVWYMYRITGDSHWREAGWRMFESINRHTATTYGNSAIEDVTSNPALLNDQMESFFLAETLKYFYLLFCDESVLSLDEWVLNTEAHPFRRPT